MHKYLFIVVIAHRGEHLHHPENTLTAFRAAIDSGADYFELDVRTSSDGKLVLMHDSTVDRMTDGTGEVAKLTLEQLQKLNVKGGGTIPTFDDALALARGRIGIYVDSKNVSAADAVAAIERHQMQDHVVIYGSASYLKQVAAMRPKMKIMPEAGSAANLRGLLADLPLKVVAFDARDFNDETIAVAKAAKVDIYVDRLGAADNEATWQLAIERGASGIQTDYPEELINYLKRKDLRTH